MQRKWRRAWKRGKPKYMKYIPAVKPIRGKRPYRRSNLAKKIVSSAVAASFFVTTVHSGFAQAIVADGRTATVITQTGKVTDVATGTRE